MSENTLPTVKRNKISVPLYSLDKVSELLKDTSLIKLDNEYKDKFIPINDFIIKSIESFYWDYLKMELLDGRKKRYIFTFSSMITSEKGKGRKFIITVDDLNDARDEHSVIIDTGDEIYSSIDNKNIYLQQYLFVLGTILRKLAEGEIVVGKRRDTCDIERELWSIPYRRQASEDIMKKILPFIDYLVNIVKLGFSQHGKIIKCKYDNPYTDIYMIGDYEIFISRNRTGLWTVTEYTDNRTKIKRSVSFHSVGTDDTGKSYVIYANRTRDVILNENEMAKEIGRDIYFALNHAMQSLTGLIY